MFGPLDTRLIVLLVTHADVLLILAGMAVSIGLTLALPLYYDHQRRKVFALIRADLAARFADDHSPDLPVTPPTSGGHSTPGPGTPDPGPGVATKPVRRAVSYKGRHRRGGVAA